MHCTNGIMIHRPFYVSIEENLSNADQCSVHRYIRRSFTSIDASVTPYKKPKNRPAPQLIDYVIVENNLIHEMVSKYNDWIWLLARYQSVQLTHIQGVPGWSGFYYQTTFDDSCKYNVSFLPAINQSPTQFDTVYEILKQVKRKTELLNQFSQRLLIS